MDINKLIKDAHEMAVKKGFYNCPECDGTKCEAVDGDTCKNIAYKYVNIPEKLMLIVSELGEACEALRKNRHADWKTLDKHDRIFNPDCGITKQRSWCVRFENDIKDTFEDEIADVYIRLADLCGYLHFYICPETFLRPYTFNEKNINISSKLFEIDGLLHYFNNMYRVNAMIEIFNALNTLCKIENIPIDKHITAKMAYNATRPYKHGKAF